jgi:hypothetical protein
VHGGDVQVVKEMAQSNFETTLMPSFAHMTVSVAFHPSKQHNPHMRFQTG